MMPPPQAAPVQRFGPVMQNGFIVRDLQAAVAHWTQKIGVGPFYLMEHISFAESFYRGSPAFIDMSVAVAQWGAVQIELIVQHNDTPSIYTEHLARHGEGLQHMGVMTASVADQLMHVKISGIEPVQWGVTSGGIRFAYLDTNHHPGGMIELIEVGPAIESFFGRVRRSAEAWDGSRPLRPLGATS